MNQELIDKIVGIYDEYKEQDSENEEYVLISGYNK